MPQENTNKDALELFENYLVVDDNGQTYNYTYISEDETNHFLPGDSGTNKINSPLGDAIFNFPVLTDGTYTTTFTLDSGNYLDISVTVTTYQELGVTRLGQIDYSITAYNEDGTIASGGGSSGTFQTSTLNAGQLEAWETAGTASIHRGQDTLAPGCPKCDSPVL